VFRVSEQTHRTSENIQAVIRASSVLVRGAREASREVLDLAHEQLTANMSTSKRLADVRSVQAFVAAQSDLMRDNLRLAIDTNRRIAKLSVRIADEATGAIQAQADVKAV
jgi:hypothetical protein